ncbi:MAG: bifunctional oligoribonuclease/PAP phosphatase NrnA [Prevotellaceae bacterium]|jgi:phosphoesterase RecJ-like protein|nr:bifunctional oligoribonuclease/PAP phosphatase NrnA [Prevotellaceae bacterium]
MSNIFSNDRIAALRRLIGESRKIVTVIHVNPDGDAIGSSMAWQTFLKEQGRAITTIAPNLFPDFLKWIPNSETVMIYSIERENCQKALQEADLLFCLDFNNLSRLDAMGEFIATQNMAKVLIDHHTGTVEQDFDLCFSQTSASSTSEIVYRIIRSISGSTRLSSPIAQALYAGVMTDTGAFAHSTSAELFRLVADLMDSGINVQKIHAQVYNNFSENRMRLMAYCIYNKMEVLPERQTAIIHLSRRELERFKFEPGDTEGFVNIPLSIKDVILSVFFVESREGFIKISFRSIGDLSVDSMSRKYFNGGGHKNAAGGKLFVPMYKAITFFKSVLPEFIDRKINKVQYQK